MRLHELDHLIHEILGDERKNAEGEKHASKHLRMKRRKDLLIGRRADESVSISASVDRGLGFRQLVHKES